MSNGPAYINVLDSSVTTFIEIDLLNANSVDPDQMPRSAASDLGLYCLPMPLSCDARHQRVNLSTPL